MEKQKILFCANSFYPQIGGAEKVCKDIVDILSKQYNVTVLTQPTIPLRNDPNIIELLATSSYSKMPGLIEYLDKNHFDLYITFGYGKHFSDAICKWTKKHNKPSIYMPCGFFHTSSQKWLKKVYATFIGFRAFTNCSIVVVATQWEKDFWVRKYNLVPGKIVVIPYNLPPNFSDFKPTDILKRYHLKKKRYLLYVGRTGPNKLIDLLKEAYEKTDKTLPLVIAGLGTEAYGGIGKVSEGDKKTLISGAKLTIFPSNYESFGMVLLESIALGTPTIGSNIGPFNEILHDNNLLFSNNIYSLASRINKAFKQKYSIPKIKLPNQEYELNTLIKTLLLMKRARNG